MKLRYAIGSTIKELRSEKKLTARQMTPYVSLGHISEIERGRKSASPEVIEAIALGLGMPTWRLILEIGYQMAIDEGVFIPDTVDEFLFSYENVIQNN